MITRHDHSAQRASTRGDDARLVAGHRDGAEPLPRPTQRSRVPGDGIRPRLNVLGVGVVVVVGLIGAVPAVSARGPSEDLVTIIGPIVEEVECDGESITRTESGWFGGPADVGNPSPYHLTRTYSDVEGKVWTYIDTGVIRVFERDGELHVSLSGRSANVGPDGTGWIGHWELNTVTDEGWRAGLGVGEIDQLACSVLASST